MADAAPERDGSGEEMKRKFREALDRKRAKQADPNAARGGQDAAKVHAAHGPARNRRSFRRKTADRQLTGLSAPGSRRPTTR